VKRWLVALALSAVAFPASAGWQSRDSNYNQNVVAGGGGGTCASALPNLLINLDASNSASVIRAGANVSAWNDLSGNGINFTAVNNPQYSATSWTGSRPGITFNNASSRYLTASTSLSTTTLSVFVVSRSTTSVQFGGIVSILGNGAGADFSAASSLAFSTDSSNVQYLATRNSGNFAASGAGNTDATGGVTFDATNGRSYLNFSLTGGPTGSTGTFGGGTTSIAVGARQTPAIGTYFDGQMAEVIITTGAISGSDLTTLHSCLTTKWGVP
jgi:hypothetical protein